MKKTFVLFGAIFLMLIVTASYGQSNKKSTEVLYFKANLCRCKAGACNALQADVDSVIVKYFHDENIEFKVIKLADAANKDLVEKYHAKSQTVVIVSKKKKKEYSIDVSDIVANYSRTKDKTKFENEMQGKIDEILKM